MTIPFREFLREDLRSKMQQMSQQDSAEQFHKLKTIVSEQPDSEVAKIVGSIGLDFIDKIRRGVNPTEDGFEITNIYLRIPTKKTKNGYNSVKIDAAHRPDYTITLEHIAIQSAADKRKIIKSVKLEDLKQTMKENW